jgi:hypothetical protein
MNDVTNLAVLAKTIFLNKPRDITLDEYINMMVRRGKLQASDTDTVKQLYKQLYGNN